MKRSKKAFNAKPVGQYKSTLEQIIRKSIGKPKGVKVQYESQSLKYLIPGTYIPDFVLTLPNGHIRYIEVKGYFRYEDKRKMAAVLGTNPGIDIRMVFSNKNTKNIKWCEKHNVPYAIMAVPKEWLSE